MLTQREKLDVFQFVPVTLSFRTCEKTFLDDLQNLAKILEDQKCKIQNLDQNPQSIPVDATKPYQFSLGMDPMLFGQKDPPGGFENVQPKEIKIPETFCKGKNLWILKPSSMSRGRGLELFTTIQELDNFLRMYLNGYDAKDFKDLGYSPKAQQGPSLSNSKKKLTRRQLTSRTGAREAQDDDDDDSDEENKKTTFQRFVIQKYMERPMLYHGFKFDIRVYACLTHERELIVFR